MVSDGAAMFQPMLAMFIWTFAVSLWSLGVRVAAIRGGVLDNAYFELFRGREPPEAVVKAGNNLRNLAEFPPLFYVAATLVWLAGATDPAFVALAWAYVALRVAHSLVHLSFNKVPPRFSCYFLSNLVLLAIWLRLALVL